VTGTKLLPNWGYPALAPFMYMQHRVCSNVDLFGGESLLYSIRRILVSVIRVVGHFEANAISIPIILLGVLKVSEFRHENRFYVILCLV